MQHNYILFLTRQMDNKHYRIELLKPNTFNFKLQWTLQVLRERKLGNSFY